MLVQFVLMLLFQVFQLLFGWSFPHRVQRFFDHIIIDAVEPIFGFMESMPFIPWVTFWVCITAIVSIYVGLLLIKFVMLIIGMIKGVFAK